MKTVWVSIILFYFLLVSPLNASDFHEDILALTSNSFTQKESVIDHLSQSYSDDERLSTLLTALLNGDLYVTADLGQIVAVVREKEDSLECKNVETNQLLEAQPKASFQKIKINNKLRSVVRSKLAELNLFSKKTSVRLQSAKDILKNTSEDNIELVTRALAVEKESAVRKVLQETDWILKVKFGSDEVKQQAITALNDALSSEALQALNAFIVASEDGNLKALAAKSVTSIEQSRSVYAWIEKAFFGLSLGSVLLLAAIGLAITFGVMKVINMAHGEMMMLGAYTTYTLQQMMPQAIEYSVLLAIPLAFCVSGLVGIIIERLVIRHLYGRPLETLLATFGISLILQQVVRSVYSPLNQEVKTPQWMSGTLEINNALSLTYNRLYIVVFSLIVFGGILALLNKTSLGLKVRAVTQNRRMAQAMGIKTGWIDALTFGLGSGIAGIAGVALSQLTNVGPNLGQAYIVDSFMVVVFGGVGNLWGTLIGAMTLGEINKFIEPVAGAVLAKVIILIFIILFIQKRPRGLFPQRGRDAQD
ncbi:urea ABC transporter permease subunit UrtB [Sulfurospirillum diekertiae]|uniref:High-affinity branched-chain amino acid transport system permease protein LivH n=1 Tax=Sulfurospirillum diekertiae TaxID=1854492 RepID=A0A290HSC0_9BACT|nr:urea ABC transporter permease subunit UrtB [Sulfurospirillum diekertiae]ATB70608.1 High-affinity branched-chain amino acid transport system permease protein LivH [Sulfurospirillum diekertiae]QIR75677.1 urea ABC transporter permease subunit UrtB [Sulfurospirillum diekertiae]QIR78324.1 urea ABC transporter permease subunit UrtB [Sulfurospirillum diekertiae]